MFEGDSVVLRCRANAEITLDTTTLHRRGEVLSVSDESSDFRIEQASLKDNGDYRCSGFKNGCCSYSSNTINIEVQGKAFVICETGLPKGRSLRQQRVRRVGWDTPAPQGSLLRESEEAQECFERKGVGDGKRPPPCLLCTFRGCCRRAVFLSRAVPGLTALGTVVILL